MNKPFICVTVAPVDAEDKKKLDRVLALSEENNTFIRKMRKAQKNSQIFKALYWVVIIGLVVSSFYFMMPYLSMLTNLYSGGAAQGSSLKIPSAAELNDLVKSIK